MQLDAEVRGLAQFIFISEFQISLCSFDFFFLGIITAAYCTFPNI